MMTKAQTKAAARAVDGVNDDLHTLTASVATHAAELAMLKQMVIDGQSNPGEIEPELSARFDALIKAVKEDAQKATDLAEHLPEVA